jgi:hypothetical protein
VAWTADGGVLARVLEKERAICRRRRRENGTKVVKNKGSICIIYKDAWHYRVV